MNDVRLVFSMCCLYKQEKKHVWIYIYTYTGETTCVVRFFFIDQYSSVDNDVIIFYSSLNKLIYTIMMMIIKRQRVDIASLFLSKKN